MWLAARYSKIFSLLAFFLPWLAVSCSNERIANPSGMNLMTGRFSASNPMVAAQTVHGQPSLLLMIALIAIVVGIGFSFLKEDDESAPLAVMSTSVIALFCIFLATVSITGYTIADQASKFQSNFGSQIAGNLISVNYAFGFYVEILCLFFAAAMAASIKFKVSVNNPLNPDFLTSKRADVSTNDVEFWDRLADKNDTDGLQEYLIRYPDGRFVELALSKLSRIGVEPLPKRPMPMIRPELVTLVEAEPVVSCRTCPECGTRYGSQVKFCESDGADLVA